MTISFFEDLSTYKDFNEAMPTLSSVIVELLRIGCPVSFRIAMKDCDITHNGRTYHFRKGDQILFQNQTEHNKENKYNQGKKWNPMAWTESIRGSSDIIGVPKEQSILTFGGKGLSFCIPPVPATVRDGVFGLIIHQEGKASCHRFFHFSQSIHTPDYKG